MSLDWLFVYGTLRPGQGNFNRFPGLALQVIEDVEVPGKLYFAWPGSYPVARFFDQHKIDAMSQSGRKIVTIKGSLLLVDLEDTPYKTVCQMELGAGYTEVIVKVDGRKDDALGFHFPGDVNPELRIRSGDWVAESGRA